MRTRHELLNVKVFADGHNVAFGEMTAEQVRRRASELRETVGWGPTTRVAPVATAWRELGKVMEDAKAQTVSDVDDDVLVRCAERLWIVPPGGSII